MTGAREPAIQRPMGAYGLEVLGLDAAASWMQPVGEDAAPLSVEVTVGSISDAPSQLSDREFDLRVLGGRLRMARDEPVARLRFLSPVPASDLLHPFLAPAAALAQQWAGREAIHAGAFAGRQGAVLLLAGKEGGKSTTLAELAKLPGIAILADDLAVIQHGAVLAGPRCIDLRAFPGGVRTDGLKTEPVRGYERWRVKLGTAPEAVPLRAIVSLAWGEGVSEARMPAVERLPALMSQRMFYDRIRADQVALLELAALPWVKLTRPRGAAGLRAAVEALSRYP